MKTWWIAPAVVLALIIGLTLWGTIPQCMTPDRKSSTEEPKP